MITTVETIQISETTTSCRVRIGDVNFDEGLDERYRRQSGADRGAAPAPPQSPSNAAEADAGPKVAG